MPPCAAVTVLLIHTGRSVPPCAPRFLLIHTINIWNDQFCYQYIFALHDMMRSDKIYCFIINPSVDHLISCWQSCFQTKVTLPLRAERRRREARRQTCTRPEVYTSRRSLLGLVDENGWKWIKIIESSWKWIPVDESGWKWMKVDGSGWKWMEMDESGWKWMNMDGK